jgi:hypothetical protein
MKAFNTPETSTSFYETTRLYVPAAIFHTRRREIVKSYFVPLDSQVPVQQLNPNLWERKIVSIDPSLFSIFFLPPTSDAWQFHGSFNYRSFPTR